MRKMYNQKRYEELKNKCNISKQEHEEGMSLYIKKQLFLKNKSTLGELI